MEFNNAKLVKRLSLRFDSYALKRDWLELSQKIEVKDRQIGLSHTVDCGPEERWQQANGSLFWKHKNPGLKLSESDFCVLNEDLATEAPYLYQVCQQMKEEFNIGRIRLMTMEPGYSYPIHKDFERRWHLPIMTTPSSFIYFKYSDQTLFDEDLNASIHGFGFHMPDDGFIYEIDAGQLHTASNPGTIGEQKTRVHLVFNECF